MEMLKITDVTTNRQHRNGTREWQLPIKNKWKSGSFIKVASFTTGYVRNQNSGYSNYQLNKRIFVDDYYPEYKSEQGHCIKTGKYHKYKTKSCVLIPKEIDRLEYLIAYCLKNYYIKHANFVAEGVYVSKWEHEYKMNGLQNKLANSVPKWKYDEAMNLGHEQDCNNYDRVKELESDVHNLETKLSNAISPTKYECEKQYSVKLEEKLYNLQNKLATIERISSNE